MLYVDTSVLVSLLLPETRSPAVRDWFRQVSLAKLGVSAWTIAEFTSALGVKVPFGATSTAAASHANATFQRLIHRGLNVITPLHRDFTDAAVLLERFDLGLRAGDTLHLAISRNHRAQCLATLDKRLAQAAAAFGLTAEIPA
jgi:uncharacterized protein